MTCSGFVSSGLEAVGAVRTHSNQLLKPFVMSVNYTMLSPKQQDIWQGMKLQGRKQHLKNQMLLGCLPQLVISTLLYWLINSCLNKNHNWIVDLGIPLFTGTLIWPAFFYIAAKLQWSWYESRADDPPEVSKPSGSSGITHDFGNY